MLGVYSSNNNRISFHIDWEARIRSIRHSCIIRVRERARAHTARRCTTCRFWTCTISGGVGRVRTRIACSSRAGAVERRSILRGRRPLQRVGHNSNRRLRPRRSRRRSPSSISRRRHVTRIPRRRLPRRRLRPACGRRLASLRRCGNIFPRVR
ncbi:hypothetical protein C8F04DRAFT_1120560 [Mycena alexandri]|uniref:Uncharacterized protein n=1 Tax=Mycena alexandri TaxID=1745969 RepID=A0AAD6SJQ4_9AGAR|nr:hypothetical protein C8F04DRAFT_1120560 [Mycena alexandri]